MGAYTYTARQMQMSTGDTKNAGDTKIFHFVLMDVLDIICCLNLSEQKGYWQSSIQPSSV